MITIQPVQSVTSMDAPSHDDSSSVDLTFRHDLNLHKHCPTVTCSDIRGQGDHSDHVDHWSFSAQYKKKLL